MNSEFNERMFEFCYNCRLINLLEDMKYKTLPPYSPTQRLEARLGFDTMMQIITNRFDCILVLQHKVSEYEETKKSSRKTSLPAPFFRFKIAGRKYSKQHDLLLELENTQFSTCYCAPMFVKNTQLTQTFQDRTILNSAICISPGKIGRFPNDANHHYCFTPDASKTEVRSEQSAAEPYRDIKEVIQCAKRKPITLEFLQSSANHLREVFAESEVKFKPYRARETNPLDELDYYIRRVIKADWLIFKSPGR